jgi:hypothetical protein
MDEKRNPAAMEVTKGELIAFLVWLMFIAFGCDATFMWFCVFAAVAFKWFGEPVAEWYADRWVAKRIAQIRQECWKQ